MGAIGAVSIVVAGCRVDPATPELDAAPQRELAQVAPGVRVSIPSREVLVDAEVCLTDGPLEQVVCAPSTREHESLLVARARPSDIHAALLLIGAKCGHPADWTPDGKGGFTFSPADGDALEVAVLANGTERPISDWIRPLSTIGAAAPEIGFRFCGSHLRPNPPSMGPGEHYVADMTGSIIGLVTFGDELVGCTQVVPDRQEFADIEWETRTEQMPALGTKVTLVLRRR